MATTGSFCPGHLMPSCLPTLARAVKSGGYVAIAVREDFVRADPVLKDLEPEIQRLEKEAVWKVVHWEQVQNYFGTETGMLYVLQVC